MFERLSDYDDLYNTPDGQELTKKLWVATKLSGTTALGLATIDVFCWSHPKTYIHGLGRYAYFVVPMLGMSSAYVLITGIAANVRQKDDMINHGIGGIAAGTIFGAWRKSRPVGFLACIVLGGTLMLKKHCWDIGWPLYGREVFKTQPSGLRPAPHDWTLIKHRTGNWTNCEVPK